MTTNIKRKAMTVVISISLMVIAMVCIGLMQHVYAGSLSFTQDAITFAADDESPEIDVDTDIGIEKWISSNEAVATVSYGGYSSASLEINGIGKTTITAIDLDGHSAKCEVTITEDDWYLDKTSVEALASDDYAEIYIRSGGYNSYTATSSNTKVAKVEMYDDNTVSISIGEVGTSTITVTDKFGKSETCTFTVKPVPLELDSPSVILDKYDEDTEPAIYLKDGYIRIESAESSNANVVKAKVEKDDDWDEIQLEPVGAGDAIITVKDKYGQTATASVTVTQKYIDESKYLEDLEDSYLDDCEYGDTSILVYAHIDLNVYTIINGKQYTGSVDEDGNYVIKGIPKLPAGTKITVYMEKGLAKTEETLTVEKKHGADLSAKIKTQVYTGKALKPNFTIKHGKYVLKKGTDYTVKYSNNKKIGKAKATVTFKGNYKGAKAVYFTIGPKGTSISKLTPTKGGFKAKWKKRTANVSGYQIQCSIDKADIAYGDKKTINKNKTTSVKVNTLWNHKYYVRIRTFKKIGSKKYYSAWSKIKSVTPKY